MSFPRYEKYKDSGVECLGEVPAHWDIVALKRVSPSQTVGIVVNPSEYVAGEGLPYLYGGDIQEGRIDLDGCRRITRENSDRNPKTKLQAGDLLTVRVGAPGVTAVVPETCEGGNCASVMLIRRGGFDSRWLCYVMNDRVVRYQVEVVQYGAAQEQFNISHAVNFIVPKPCLDEQVAIADHLDRETAKIDALVDEQTRLIELQREELQCLVSASRSANGTKVLRFGNAAQVMLRPVLQKEGELYRPLGMYNRGRGIFHKEAREMAEMGDSDFFWVRCGDLVISGQFAWEGAVGLASEEEDRCVVSHRYPVLRGRAGVALTEYLYALLLTKHGDFMLNESSWGAAGRNRPLNLGLLLKEKIWLPSLQTQVSVANAVRRSKQLAAEIDAQLALLQERRSALVSAAVTGKIDVRGLVPQPEAA